MKKVTFFVVLMVFGLIGCSGDVDLRGKTCSGTCAQQPVNTGNNQTGYQNCNEQIQFSTETTGYVLQFDSFQPMTYTQANDQLTVQPSAVSGQYNTGYNTVNTYMIINDNQLQNLRTGTLLSCTGGN